jgi:hypothetical protein
MKYINISNFQSIYFLITMAAWNSDFEGDVNNLNIDVITCNMNSMMTFYLLITQSE